jgi:hypothetical protein
MGTCAARARAPVVTWGATTQATNNAVLCEAAAQGRVSVVRSLLRDDHVEPAAWSSRALRTAAFKGHATVVRALLADGRSDPAVHESAALRDAAFNGDHAVVRALLADGRADPAAIMPAAIMPPVREHTRQLIQAAVRWRRRRPWLRASWHAVLA